MILRDIVLLYNVLAKILTNDLEVKLLLKLKRIFKKIEPEFKSYDEIRINLIKKLGEEQKKGEYKITGEENIVKFNEEISKIIDEKLEIEIDNIEININDLPIKLNILDMETLEKFFKVVE